MILFVVIEVLKELTALNTCLWGALPIRQISVNNIEYQGIQIPELSIFDYPL